MYTGNSFSAVTNQGVMIGKIFYLFPHVSVLLPNLRDLHIYMGLYGERMITSYMLRIVSNGLSPFRCVRNLNLMLFT